MNLLNFPYVEREHSLFGTVKRPVVTLNLYSKRFARWFILNNVLVDTGADVSILPFPLPRFSVERMRLIVSRPPL